jgi:hypothetical protein
MVALGLNLEELVEYLQEYLQDNECSCNDCEGLCIHCQVDEALVDLEDDLASLVRKVQRCSRDNDNDEEELNWD